MRLKFASSDEMRLFESNNLKRILPIFCDLLPVSLFDALMLVNPCMVVRAESVLFLVKLGSSVRPSKLGGILGSILLLCDVPNHDLPKGSEKAGG